MERHPVNNLRGAVGPSPIYNDISLGLGSAIHIMSTEAQLESLLEVINSSARQAIAEYKKGGNDVPTINSPEFHPLDNSAHNVVLRKAVRVLEGACQQLCASLAPPQRTVLNVSSLSCTTQLNMKFITFM